MQQKMDTVRCFIILIFVYDILVDADDWIRHKNKEYKIHSHQVSFDVANETCTAQDGNLVTILSQSENNYLQNRLSPSNSYWIGLSLKLGWYWPNNKRVKMENRTGDCALLAYYDNDPKSVPCEESSVHIVCQQVVTESGDCSHGFNKTNDMCYWMATSKTPYDEDICRQMNAEILTLDTEERRKSSRKFFAGDPYRRIWVNAHRRRVFSWTSEKSVHWTNFAEYAYITEDLCVYILPSDGLWRLGTCGSKKGFICEKELDVPATSMMPMGASSTESPDGVHKLGTTESSIDYIDDNFEHSTKVAPVSQKETVENTTPLLTKSSPRSEKIIELEQGFFTRENIIIMALASSCGLLVLVIIIIIACRRRKEKYQVPPAASDIENRPLPAPPLENDNIYHYAGNGTSERRMTLRRQGTSGSRSEPFEHMMPLQTVGSIVRQNTTSSRRRLLTEQESIDHVPSVAYQNNDGELVNSCRSDHRAERPDTTYMYLGDEEDALANMNMSHEPCCDPQGEVNIHTRDTEAGYLHPTLCRDRSTHVCPNAIPLSPTSLTNTDTVDSQKSSMYFDMDSSTLKRDKNNSAASQTLPREFNRPTYAKIQKPNSGTTPNGDAGQYQTPATCSVINPERMRHSAPPASNNGERFSSDSVKEGSIAESPEEPVTDNFYNNAPPLNQDKYLALVDTP